MKKSKVIDLFDNKKIVKNKGVKYSELLEKFMEPFISYFDDFETYEEIFSISILAWNMGNMGKDINADILNSVISREFSKEMKDLIKKMVYHKVENFSEHTNLIVDFQVKGPFDAPILSVITQTNEAYHEKMDEDNFLENNLFEDDFLDGDFFEDNNEPGYINRHAFVFKRKEPYKKWLHSLDITEDLDIELLELFNESALFLIEDNTIENEEWLKKNWRTIFINDLDMWEENKKKWPKKRTYKMFKEWFSVDFSTMVYDLEDSPVYK